MDRNSFPPKPTEPDEAECCGTGCTPCVFDVYKNQLERWELERKRLSQQQIHGVESSEINGLTEIGSTPRLTPEKYENFRLVDIIPEADYSNIYRFNCTPVSMEDSVRVRFDLMVEIGQHVVLQLDSLCRQYTILRLVTHNENDCFDILIKIYPEGCLTPRIANLNVSDVVSVRGPFGKPFTLRPNSFKSVFLLAAGTGIAPFYRIIESILNNEDDYTRVVLWYSNRSVSHILLRSQLTQWSGFWNFHTVHYLTRNCTEAVPYGMNVRLKRIGLYDLKKLNEESDESMYLICGTRSFEKDMINYLKRLDVEDKRVKVF